MSNLSPSVSAFVSSMQAKEKKALDFAAKIEALPKQYEFDEVVSKAKELIAENYYPECVPMLWDSKLTYTPDEECYVGTVYLEISTEYDCLDVIGLTKEDFYKLAKVLKAQTCYEID